MRDANRKELEGQVGLVSRAREAAIARGVKNLPAIAFRIYNGKDCIRVTIASGAPSGRGGKTTVDAGYAPEVKIQEELNFLKIEIDSYLRASGMKPISRVGVWFDKHFRHRYFDEPTILY